MVRSQLAGRGIRDRRVLAAMDAVPRELFVDEHLAADAYADSPLVIGCGQTISQPYMVALMAQAAAIRRTDSVLDVGTGSGYQAAVLAHLAREVWSIERLPPLADDARRRLDAIGVRNVTVVVGDGAFGHPQGAPYDAIVVAAAAPRAPDALLSQLTLGGRLVIPLGNRELQDLTIVERTSDGAAEREAGGCRFVPLISPAAFPDGR